MPTKYVLYFDDIPQGSILGRLLFNIFVNDLFFFSAKCEISNFADDNSLYSCGMDLAIIFVNEWFVYSSMKANHDKFQFIILGNTGWHTQQIGDITIKSASSATLVLLIKNWALKNISIILWKNHTINYMPS